MTIVHYTHCTLPACGTRTYKGRPAPRVTDEPLKATCRRCAPAAAQAIAERRAAVVAAGPLAPVKHAIASLAGFTRIAAGLARRDGVVFAIGVGTPAGILWFDGLRWTSNAADAVVYPDGVVADELIVAGLPEVNVPGAGGPWLQSVIDLAKFWGGVPTAAPDWRTADGGPACTCGTTGRSDCAVHDAGGDL